MTLPTVQRKEIEIGGITILAFRQGLNDYYLNLSQIGELIGKPHSSAAQFLASKAFEGLPCKASEMRNFPKEHGKPFKGVPLSIVKADIGLNYQEDIDNLNRIADVKLAFAGYRKGSHQERIDRAIAEVDKAS